MMVHTKMLKSSMWEIKLWDMMTIRELFSPLLKVGHNVPCYGEKTIDYIWEIPIKDFLAASDEVQRNCLMPKPNQVIFKSAQGKFYQIWAASWLVDAWVGVGVVKLSTIYVNEILKAIG